MEWHYDSNEIAKISLRRNSKEAMVHGVGGRNYVIGERIIVARRPVDIFLRIIVARRPVDYIGWFAGCLRTLGRYPFLSEPDYPINITEYCQILITLGN
ncbi:hypothetical protein KC19_VG083900 [Ceratodon purpureus]|uniref:Uncharacterized protein n=1 Tax=Ceratodon purpureus TaxID=3225 RepID=A0A8T0HNA0_CERPU|nr:hypothetical protein KC19_VG083900 [Ceratodon purpureus]